MSNRRMENTPTPEPSSKSDSVREMLLVERRLNELEIKASFTEDLLEQLDKVVIRQQQQIDLLVREVTELRRPAASESGGGDGAPARSLREDMPPHF